MTADTIVYTCKTAVEAAIENLPDKTEMVYVGQGDELTEDQVGWLLAGDIDKVWESFENWEGDQRWDSARQYLIDCTGGGGPYYTHGYGEPVRSEWHDAIFDSPTAFEDFRAECDERDESDPLRDLMRQTEDPMIRYSVGYDLPGNSWSWDSDSVEEAMEEIADALGIVFHDSRNRHALRSLVVEASYGGTLCILHRTPLKDALRMNKGGTVVFTDPMVLVYDGWNGSGSMEQIMGTIIVKVDEDTMKHDAGSYSWSDGIAGIVHSCAATPAVFTPNPQPCVSCASLDPDDHEPFCETLPKEGNNGDNEG